MSPSNLSFVLIAMYAFAAWTAVVANAQCGSSGWIYSASDPGFSSGVARLVTWDSDGNGPLPEELVAQGTFGIASWNGTSWRSLGFGQAAGVNVLISWDPDNQGPALPLLVAAVGFSVKIFNGTEWADLGPSLDIYPLCATTWDPDGSGPNTAKLVVGGMFSNGNAVRVWNGSTWTTPFIDGTNYIYTASQITTWDYDNSGPLGPQVVVAGRVARSNGLSFDGVARFNGTAWAIFDEWDPSGIVPAFGAISRGTPDGFTVGRYGETYGYGGAPGGASFVGNVRALAAWDPDGPGPILEQIAIGGDFANHVSCYPIPVNTGTNGVVTSLTTWDPDGTGGNPAVLVMGGGFTSAGGQPANNIVMWGRDGRSRWINPNGGAWTTAANWSKGVVPAACETIIFDVSGTYTVTAVPAQPGRAIQVSAGSVTLRSSQTSHTLLGNIELQSGELKIEKSIDVQGNVQIAAGAKLGMSGKIGGNLSNEGELTLRTQPMLGLPCVSNSLNHNGIYIVGDCTLGSTSKLVVEVAGFAYGQYGSLLLSGNTQLGGTLKIRSTSPTSPVPGTDDPLDVITRFGTGNLIPTGGFQFYEGLSIDNNVFWGVFERKSYYTRSGTCLNISAYVKDVELLPLTTPRLETGSPITGPRVGRPRLAIVTHGWRSSINFVIDDDLFALGSRMQGFADQFLPPLAWDVAYMDWRQYAGGDILPPNDQTHPVDPSRHAESIGRSLAIWMFERGWLSGGLNSYTGFHTIGHSAGSWLADAFIKTVTSYGASLTPPLAGVSVANCHTTFLDAFSAPVLVDDYGSLGSSNVASDQYFDHRDRFGLFTSQSLPFSFNFDVTLNSNCLFNYYDDILLCTITHHAWPKLWYRDSIPAIGTIPSEGRPCTGRIRSAGFEQSPMFDEFIQNLVPFYGCTPDLQLQRGIAYCVAANRDYSRCVEHNTPVSSQGFAADTISPGPTGTVTTLPNQRVRVRTGSPVEFTTTQQIGGIAHNLAFSVRVETGSSGLLMVGQDGLLVGAADVSLLSEMPVDSEGFVTVSALELLHEVGPGAAAFTFRLETGDGTTTELTLSSLQFTGTQISCDSIDFNNDTSFFDPQDIEAFLSVYSEGPCVPATATCGDIDFNNDTGVFDPCDISSFLVVYSEGPCTPCGQ